MPSPVRSVAFLRGMNVGGHRITNERLAAEVTAAGCSDVATFQAAGNVVLCAPAGEDDAATEARLERHLEAALGYAVPTMVRTLDHVGTVAATMPFREPPAQVGAVLHVAFCKTAPTAAARRAALAMATPTDELHLEGRELYWLRHGKLMDASVDAVALRRTLGVEITMRTASTLQRLWARFATT